MQRHLDKTAADIRRQMLKDLLAAEGKAAVDEVLSNPLSRDLVNALAQHLAERQEKEATS
jgi:hypothetical protein